MATPMLLEVPAAALCDGLPPWPTFDQLSNAGFVAEARAPARRNIESNAAPRESTLLDRTTLGSAIPGASIDRTDRCLNRRARAAGSSSSASFWPLHRCCRCCRSWVKLWCVARRRACRRSHSRAAPLRTYSSWRLCLPLRVRAFSRAVPSRPASALPERYPRSRAWHRRRARSPS